MKCKMLALILALTVVPWAQTPTQSAPSTPQQSTAPAGKAKCPCRAKMAAGNANDAHAWCAHHEMGAKDSTEMASYCSGKTAKSCVRKDKDGTMASCCKDGRAEDICSKDKTAAAGCGSTCSKDGRSDCCSGKTAEKSAKSCCKLS